MHSFAGLGQPEGGQGILSSALPMPETVIEGVERITTELMAFGYARTGKAAMTDHFISASCTLIVFLGISLRIRYQ